jgi:hypothetical protein
MRLEEGGSGWRREVKEVGGKLAEEWVEEVGGSWN